MPSKKKKFNARFPPARIKKIMQTDEDVGKVAAAVPVIISRALELFIQSLILKASETTRAKHAKTLSSSHIKQTIQSEKQFDFLKDLVASIPDVAPAEEESSEPSSSLSSVPERVVAATTPRPRGRPKKKPVEGEDVPKIPKKRGRKPKVAAVAVVAQPATTASSSHDSSDSSDVEPEPENNLPPPLPPTQSTEAPVSIPATLHPELPGHTLPQPPSPPTQSLQSRTAAPDLPPPHTASAMALPQMTFPAPSSIAQPNVMPISERNSNFMQHAAAIPAPSSIAHTTYSAPNSTAPPVQNSMAPPHATIPTPSALPHPLPYTPPPRTSDLPMNLSAPASHIPHPAFYHPSSYQANTSGALDLSKSAQPPSDSAVTTSAQPPMFAMPQLGGRFPHYPMLPGYSQHMGLPPMLTRPPLISSMMPPSTKPSGTPGELPPGYPQLFAGYPQRPRPSASEDYDS